jgi:hypothetical protein
MKKRNGVKLLKRDASKAAGTTLKRVFRPFLF